MTELVIALLALWWIVAALYQLKLGFMQVLRGRDALSLIPNWSFFAPRPGTHDYHLLFRDASPTGELQRWREIPLADPRTLSGAIWNPSKRCKKALSDTVRALVQLSRDGRVKAVPLSIPYIATLNYVSSVPREGPYAATQFMILQSGGFISTEDPQLIFMSNFHSP